MLMLNMLKDWEVLGSWAPPESFMFEGEDGTWGDRRTELKRMIKDKT